MWALIKRDVMLTLRTRSVWLMGIVFFFAFVALIAIALGGQLSAIRPLAPALIWTGFILSMLLSFNDMFAPDIADGTTEQLLLSGIGAITIVTSKALAYALCVILPLIIAIPLAAPLLGQDITQTAAIMITAIISAPALVVYSLFTSALLTGQRNGGVLAIIMTTPFLIPLMIFALSAIDNYPSQGLWSADFQFLFGLSLIGFAIGLPAGAAALRANMDTT